MNDEVMKEFLKTAGFVAASGALSALAIWIVQEQLAGRAPKQLTAGNVIDVTAKPKKIRKDRSKKEIK